MNSETKTPWWIKGRPKVNNCRLHQQRSTKRQAQNREAQRRFRERREQERANLVELLEKLQEENLQISKLLDRSKKQCLTLEAGIKQSQAEAENLRRWRQKVMCSMAELIPPKDTFEGIFTDTASGCSYDCWRTGMQLRALIAMQTLASLFREPESPYLGKKQLLGGHTEGDQS